jgi:hypothetical protein
VLASEEYARRLELRRSAAAELERVHIRLGNARLAIAILGAVLVWASVGRHLLSPWWIVAPVAAFLTIVAYHYRILRSKDRAERAIAFYEAGLARVDDRWSGVGEAGTRFAAPHHPYSADLDLFGQGGLFQLLYTARTRVGEETLARWLLAPAPVPEIRERQAAVAELRSQIDLREDLAVLGSRAGVGVYPYELLRWAESPRELRQLWIPNVAKILVILLVVTLFLYGYRDWATPLILVLLVEGSLAFMIRKPMELALHSTEHAFQNLDLLSGIFDRIETHTFHAPRLVALQQALSASGVRASLAVDRLRTLVDFINSRDNVFVRVVDIPLLYSVQLAFLVERWRQTHGHAMASWLDAIGQMEALLSFGGYSFEHPTDTFPEFAEGPPHFEAQQLAHPLLPAATCVRNQVHLSESRRTLLVSGSNMSGKSTLLRAVGVNTVLAMAGAPVRAGQLLLTPLHVGASIRVNDSLQEGSSRFYAEITRLRQIFDLAASDPPLLFLLDELLQGTNSKDRRIGAEGVLRALLGRSAIGLISTHDLALTEMDASLGELVHNVHFQDEFEHGRIKFDYQLREGVVSRSNGLELMRSIGLDV